MRRISYIYTFSALLILTSQSVFAGWHRTYGGPDFDAGYWMEITDDDCYMICGGTEVNPSPKEVKGILLKVDPEGDSLWEKTHRVSKYMYGNTKFFCLQQTNDKGFILTGQGDGDGYLPDLVLLKTDSAGDSIWARYYEKGYADFGYYVCQTADGGYIVTGNCSVVNANFDIWVLRTDSLGDTLWTYIFDSGDDDHGNCVMQIPDGNFVVTGFSEGDEQDVTRLIKLDDEGNVLWNKNYGNNSLGWGMTQTSDGGFVITGSSWGNSGILLLKTDENGDSLWSQTYWNTVWCQGNCVVETSDGGFIIAGMKNWNPLASTGDGWLIKTDSIGDTLWTRTLIAAPGNNNSLHCVCQTSDQGYIVAGSTNPKSVDKGFEIWLVKTDSLGLLGIEEFDNPPSVEASTVVGRGVSFSYSNLDAGFHAVVYSSEGRRIAEIHDDSASGTITWGQGHQPGVYFIKELSGTIPVRKVILIK